ncbi:glycosyltransferase family 1 protein [Parathielavia hyrcaniae]|uniref:UDP-N-acetylglucosamine transferase subunit ALG13 n=1 Tax=Parathielavia hyrcaniae TaxID=113614 RepID=A0AAN6Q2Y4_9PEZI|nr:glycosyltransferase family 1 protein [Parathielavia hyrcaniae]
MTNGFHGVGGDSDSDSASSFGSEPVTAAQARELKNKEIDFLKGHCQAHQTTAPPRPPQLPGRHCLVTVGATAGFRSLLEEVSSAGFLVCLACHGYATLELQCGPDLDTISARVARLTDEERCGISVVCFGYTTEMQSHILVCRGEANVRPAGCVISHGGTGTVGEVLSVGAPLIVVANSTLMDNHQLELAESLENEGRAVVGHLGTLVNAVDIIADRITQGTLDALPPYCPPSFPVSAADRVTLFDWMVLTCYPAEFAAQMNALNQAVPAANLANARLQQPGRNGNRLPEAVNNQGDNGMLQLDLEPETGLAAPPGAGDGIQNGDRNAPIVNGNGYFINGMVQPN